MKSSKRTYITFTTLLALFTLVTSGYSQENNSLDSLYIKGLLYFNNNKLDSAKILFSKHLKKEPKDNATYYYLSKIAIANKDITSGEMYLKRAIELDSTNFWYRNNLGDIYYNTNKAAEAINVYESLIKDFPKKTSSYYNLINLYIATKDLVKAGEVLDKIEEIGGINEAVAITRYNIFRMEQNWEGALEYLIKADNELKSPNLETYIGDMYAERFKDTLALNYYTKALTSMPSYTPALYGRAEIYRLKGDYTSYFKDITPFFADAAVDIKMKGEYIRQLFQTPGFTQRFRANVDSLIINLEQAHPTDSTALYLVAAYNSQGGNTKEAARVLKKNAEVYNQSNSALMQYIVYLYQIKEWEELERETKRLLTSNSSNLDFIQLQGIAEHQQGKLNDAISTYTRLGSIALDRKDTLNIISSYSLLGDIYAGIGNTSKAYHNYKKALKYDPKNNAVLNNYAYYLSLEGKKLKLAYTMSEQTVKTEPDNPTYLDTFGWILYLLDRPLEAKAQFKHAMLYGGKESAAVLDHYAEVLFKLKEYDLAFIYWDQVKKLDNSLGIEEKIKIRKEQMKNEK